MCAILFTTKNSDSDFKKMCFTCNRDILLLKTVQVSEGKIERSLVEI